MQVLHQDTALHFKPKAFLLGVGVSTLVIVAAGGVFFKTTYQNTFFNGVMIDSVNVSKMTREQALSQLDQKQDSFSQTVSITVGDTTIASTAAELGLHRDYSQALDQAYQFGRSQDFFKNINAIVVGFSTPQRFQSKLEFEPEKVQELVTLVAVRTHIKEEVPTAALAGGTISINPGKTGSSIVIEDVTSQILQSANTLVQQDSLTLTPPRIPTGKQLTEVEVQQALQRAEKFKGSSIEAKHDVTTITVSDAQMIEALNFPSGFKEDQINSILETFRQKIDRPAQNAQFEYDPTTLKVTTFQPDLDGLTIDTSDTKAQILSTLKTIEESDTKKNYPLELKIAAKPADIPLSSLNTIGINERIGFGESYYEHSIPSRIHNVSRASEIVNNTIVKPGDEFSFNKTLGEVSKSTGFQPAYVIKSGQTVLGDGGGVCQVSTTLFRALLDSGLNITKRKAHSYRVSYYELNRDPGFDATVYAGDVDLRFINDTPGAVLLQFKTYPEQKYMFVSIYGTSDGRTTQVVNYKKWDAVRAPASQYFDDPTLPPGKLVQIDWAVGGIKAQFTNVVKDKDGNVIRENTYYSNYIPWAAKYRRGV